MTLVAVAALQVVEGVAGTAVAVAGVAVAVAVVEDEAVEQHVAVDDGKGLQHVQGERDLSGKFVLPSSPYPAPDRSGAEILDQRAAACATAAWSKISAPDRAGPG